MCWDQGADAKSLEEWKEATAQIEENIKDGNRAMWQNDLLIALLQIRMEVERGPS